MKAFIIVLCAIFALAQGASLNNRIVGGETAKPGQFKYIASLRRGDSHSCGATIIGRRVLLTAAHCKVNDVKDTVAVVGTTKLNDQEAKRYALQDFIIHENYNPSTITNDVAVIILKEDITFDADFVQSLPLASRAVSDDERLTSAGWGHTSYPGSSLPNDLQWMQMNVMSHQRCMSVTGDSNLDGQICTLEAAGEGICKGDSGGPLVNELDEIVGITSSAYLCALGMPDFFTDVFYYKDWIVEHAGENM